MAAILSSPLSSFDNSPYRTFGKFVPLHDVELTSPILSHKAKRQERKVRASELDECMPASPGNIFAGHIGASRKPVSAPKPRSTDAGQCIGPVEPKDIPAKNGTLGRIAETRNRTCERNGYVEKTRKRERERDQLIDEIVGLDKRQRIEILLAEIDHVNLRVEMQGKALDALITKTAKDKHVVEGRLHALENGSTPFQQAAAASTNDLTAAKKDHEALKALVKKVARVEEDANERFATTLTERVENDAMKEVIEAIDIGIEEVRVEMRGVLGTLGLTVEEDVGGESKGILPESENAVGRKDSGSAPLCRKRKSASAEDESEEWRRCSSSSKRVWTGGKKGPKRGPDALAEWE